MRKEHIEYSIVVPVFNEEENVEALHCQIDDVMQSMSASYEIVFIDDGSVDKTFAILKAIKRDKKSLKVIKFRKNFGQSAAMRAGFEYASGDVILGMDGDLQNDPQDIPKMVAKLNEGFDIVNGWRKDRKDKMILRKIPSRIANRLIQRSTKVDIHDTGCSLKAYKKHVVKRIRVYGELHRFIPALASMEGASVGEMVVTHHSRQFGKSKYNITRTFRVVMDLMTLNLLMKYLSSPIYFFGALAVGFNVAGMAILGIMLFCWTVLGFSLEEINVLLATAFIFIAGGFQSLFFGLIADTVVRTGDRKSIRSIENTNI
jgi:glycosyltransferase involved in cell wall biosynthesis